MGLASSRLRVRVARFAWKASRNQADLDGVPAEELCCADSENAVVHRQPVTAEELRRRGRRRSLDCAEDRYRAKLCQERVMARIMP